jgi:uncharacterized membrane protein YbhN (UPF0104 family)
MAISRESQPKRSSGRTILWSVTKIALALALAGVVLSYTNLNELVALLNRVSIAWLVISCLSFYGSVWVAARRYWFLIGQRASFHDTLQLVIVQTLVTNFIATGAGAVSYVAVLRGKHQIAIGRGIASLILARLGDALILIIGLATSAWLAWSGIGPLHGVVLTLVNLAIGGGVVAVLAILFRRTLTNLMNRSLLRTDLRRRAWVIRLEQTVSDLANQDRVNAKKAVGPFAIYTVGNFGFMVLFSYSLLRTFDVSIGLPPIMFIVSLTQLIGLVPIQVFGGLGVLDLTNLYLYSLFGLNQLDMAPVIVGTRILFYLSNLLLLGRFFAMKRQG